MNKYKNPEEYKKFQQQKKQKTKKPLVLRLSLNIAQNDLDRLKNKAKQTLESGRQVTFDLALKGREKYIHDYSSVSSKMRGMLSEFQVTHISNKGRFFRTTVNKLV